MMTTGGDVLNFFRFLCLPKWRCRLYVYFLSFTLLIGGLFAFWNLGYFLVLDFSEKIPPQKSLAIVLMGNLTRVLKVEELYQKGQIGKIILCKTWEPEYDRIGLSLNEGELARKHLIEHGIPEEDIIFLDSIKVNSTQAEALVSLDYVRTLPEFPKELVLITSWYHTSRAYYVFSKVFKDFHPNSFKIYAIASYYDGHPKHYWKDKESFLKCYVEVLKWVYYFLSFLFGT
jgi:uncharacterized SAM-binding protein YcdF (DUF218 family)